MGKSMSQRAGGVIALLNGISVGELDSIRSKLEAARRDLLEVEQKELAASVEQAQGAIQKGDLQDFRRLVAQVVSKLGHVRDQPV